MPQDRKWTWSIPSEKHKIGKSKMRKEENKMETLLNLIWKNNNYNDVVKYIKMFYKR